MSRVSINRLTWVIGHDITRGTAITFSVFSLSLSSSLTLSHAHSRSLPFILTCIKRRTIHRDNRHHPAHAFVALVLFILFFSFFLFGWSLMLSLSLSLSLPTIALSSPSRFCSPTVSLRFSFAKRIHVRRKNEMGGKERELNNINNNNNTRRLCLSPPSLILPRSFLHPITVHSFFCVFLIVRRREN